MDQDIAAVPWADIYENPSDYYDTNHFALPAQLQSPDHLSLTNVLMIAQYLASHSFSFRPKADILDKRRNRNAEKEAQHDDGEEVDSDSALGMDKTGGQKRGEDESTDKGEDKRRNRNAGKEAQHDDGEEVDSDSAMGMDKIGGEKRGEDESTDKGESGDEETADGEDAKKKPHPRRTSSRTKRSATDNGTDADAVPPPGRKSKRIQKDTAPADKATRPPKRKATGTDGGSTAGNKVCLTPLAIVVLPN
jgi:hypothetical protein